LKTAKSLLFEAPEHAEDGERPDVLDLIRSQHQCADCKMQQRIDSIQCKHIKEITDLQRELQLIKKERDDYRQNFADAQEQIFSMQPHRSDITEDVAIQEYSSLCIAVENWIESRLDAVLDLDAKIFTHSTAVDLTSGTRLLRCITSTPGAANSRNIVGTLQYYIRSAIMNFICHEIFKPELYEIISQQWKLIRTVENSMENREPRRG
jgi:phage host-nuclease inhibitor protein Gam